MRIALVAVLALAAVWFVALRPKPDSAASTPAPAPTAPGVAGLTRSIDKARAATAAANAAAAKEQATATGTSNGTGGKAAPSQPTATVKPKAVVVKPKAVVVKPKAVVVKPKAVVVKPKAVVVKPTAPKAVAKPKPRAVAVSPAAPLVAALAHHKVVVLMFGNSSSDSHAVAAAVKRLPRRHGKVVIRITNISQVGRYAVFTTDTPVTQAPTVLIIGSSRKGRVIVGYTYTGELDQAVADVMASKPAK